MKVCVVGRCCVGLERRGIEGCDGIILDKLDPAVAVNDCSKNGKRENGNVSTNDELRGGIDDVYGVGLATECDGLGRAERGGDRADNGRSGQEGEEDEDEEPKREKRVQNVGTERLCD